MARQLEKAALSPPQSACGVDPFHAVFFCAAGAFRMKAHGLRKKPLPAVFSIANPVPARTRSRESSNCALDSRPALRGRVERLNRHNLSVRRCLGPDAAVVF